ncbi:hypothetical protein HPB48_002385 [Haemaphysalis longicornis]|uniref:Mutator-like transposase domain-containing protein n=1 Tax=Haemaphysalis longicornis TaxID=44386 RepID=A0A9J6GY53_HAELO|nr:hypothetical protein HPB48_002385 [Haemaphysalis longicornis]
MLFGECVQCGGRRGSAEDSPHHAGLQDPAQHKEFFAKLAVDAVTRLKGSGNLDAIQVLKKLGGSLTDSYLAEGFLLDKRPGVHQPKRVEKARILIANTPMDADKVKVFGSRVRVQSVAQIAEMELAEKVKMKEKVDQILKHDINVFINRQLIYNYPEQLFADAGVMAIEHADFDGIERLALVTGGEIVSTFNSPELVRLGTCDLIEEVMVGEDKLLQFSGVPLGQACTVVIRGATQQILDEADRSLHDVLCVLSQALKDKRVVYGGGSSEMLMASAVCKLAESTPGKEALAMEAFARALRQIPTIIADNAGFDSAQLVSELRAAHSEGKRTAGISRVVATSGRSTPPDENRSPPRIASPAPSPDQPPPESIPGPSTSCRLDTRYYTAEEIAARTEQADRGAASAGLAALDLRKPDWQYGFAVKLEVAPSDPKLQMRATKIGWQTISCQRNIDCGAGRMEVEAAMIMFKRSLSKNGLRYTTVMSDGDSRTMHGLKEKGVYGFIPIGQENMVEARVDDMKELGIAEALVVKRQVLLSAAEAAEMILRVDNIIKAAPRQRHPDRSH